ncbi:MAG: HAMP domain-containing protein [Deltaproteobacteria bacterium]|nr:HAMP domain-containing protein [Deltaproteobacteria bacterium]
MRLSLATKIFLGFALVVCTFGAVTAYSLVTLHRVGEDIRVTSQAYLPLTTVAAQVETSHKNRSRDLQRLLDEKDPRTQRALIKLAQVYYPQELHRRIAAGRALTQASLSTVTPGERDFLTDLDKRFADLNTHYQAFDTKAEALFALLQSDKPDAAVLKQQGAELLAVQQQLDRDIHVLSSVLDARVSFRVATAGAEERRGAFVIIILTIGAILLGLLVTLGSLRVLAPIRRLTEGASRIGRGDYATLVDAEGTDEMALLGREFNAMAASLREREAQLAQKQQELVRAERLAAMGRVTAQITHEIRNPLSSIGLNAEMLEEGLASAQFGTPEQARESLELLGAIAREVDRLTEITEQYLRFARAPKPQLASEDVNAVVGALLDFLAPELQGAQLHVDRAFVSGPLWAVCDEGQLRQALLNLVRNAREAMEGKPGTLRVETSQRGERVEIAVQDNGPGVSAEDLARIFDPFFSTKQRGTGLGLAVTQQIIREHGGEISCTSTPGLGTRFIVSLPRAEQPSAQSGERAALPH